MNKIHSAARISYTMDDKCKKSIQKAKMVYITIHFFFSSFQI